MRCNRSLEPVWPCLGVKLHRDMPLRKTLVDRRGERWYVTAINNCTARQRLKQRSVALKAIRRDDRNIAGKRFKRDGWESFVVRRDDEEVCGVQVGDNAFDESGHVDAPVYAQLYRQLDKVRAQRAITKDGQAGAAVRYKREGAKQPIEALLGHHSPNSQYLRSRAVLLLVVWCKSLRPYVRIGDRYKLVPILRIYVDEGVLLLFGQDQDAVVAAEYE